MNRHSNVFLHAFAFILSCFQGPPVADASDPVVELQKPLSGSSTGYVGPNQLNGAMFGIAEPHDWTSDMNAEVSRKLNGATRGVSGPIYAKVGPAVVVVRVGKSHGTGFLIEDDWIITNQHVAAMGLLDLSTGARIASVHFGRYQDGLIHVDREAYTAMVYATDEDRDLALLRLVEKPAYFDDIKPIKISEVSGVPGNDCISIGHPSAGLLWTLRSGEITGVATWPHERIDALMTSLAATGTNAAEMQTSLDAMPKRQVILSTCPINPGDSGGPLLNTDGELLGITFGIPKGGDEQGISLDKFSYHVHANELKAFIERKPKTPEVAVPSPWPSAVLSSLEDSDGDGHWDTWSFAIEKRGAKTGIMFDLDQDTPAAFKESYITDVAMRVKWDFEFAITFTPFVRTFYDTDNDGEVDLILSDVKGDRVAELVVSKKDGIWQRIDMPGQITIDPKLFKNEELTKRLIQMLNAGK